MDCRKFIELTKNNIGDVCIFGAGDYGSTWCFELLKDAGFNIVCYIDNFKTSGICNGLPIYPLQYLIQHKELFVFVSTRGNAEKEILGELIENGIENYYCFESDYAPVELAIYINQLGDEKLIGKFPSVMDDEIYLKIRFKYRMGYALDLKSPQTFNEKLNWLKLYDRNPVYITLVDKCAVKDYVSNIIGPEYVVPLYGVWSGFEDIDFTKMPNRFVLKCSHNCGDVIVCKDKTTFDIESAKVKLEKALNNNAFWPDREWPYRYVKPFIIAEKYIEPRENVLDVYKFFCFHGEPFLLQVIQNDKTKNESIDYYDINWNYLDLHQNYPNSLKPLDKPAKFQSMFDISRKLSLYIPFVRVDLFVDKAGDIFFSEFTFYSDSGCERFYPDKWDYILGDLIDLKRCGFK